MVFDPAVSAGSNKSTDLAISLDGHADRDQIYLIPARCGRAVRLDRGDMLTIVNPNGQQVCDFWAFAWPDLREYMSMAHCHTALESILPKTGDRLVTNARRDILAFIEDSSPGIHDTVIAACDAMRYRQLGAEGYHDNCTDNLRMALTAIGQSLPAVPAPLNLWMNIPVAQDGVIEWCSPVAEPGDYVRFQALMECIAVMSACPQDMTPVNGAGNEPTGLSFSVQQGTV